MSNADWLATGFWLTTAIVHRLLRDRQRTTTQRLLRLGLALAVASLWVIGNAPGFGHWKIIAAWTTIAYLPDAVLSPVDPEDGVVRKPTTTKGDLLNLGLLLAMFTSDYLFHRHGLGSELRILARTGVAISLAGMCVTAKRQCSTAAVLFAAFATAFYLPDVLSPNIN